MRNMIGQAIKERRLLTFNYDGFPRTVEPHCHGITTAGKEAIRCYQTGGGSSSGKVPGWHLMTVDKIMGLAVSSTTFSGPRPEYKKGDKQMSSIFTEL